MKARHYVLVTPARNEEAYIKGTIESVVSQTIPPQKWVIVSDGSVDRTDEIVASYARRYTFIQLIRMQDDGRRSGQKDFGAKVTAFRAGYQELGGTRHQFLGNLDADITMAPSYFAELLDRFDSNPNLGLGGGIVLEPDKGRLVPQHTSLNSVCGSVQLFRRECYEAFGGYVPIRMGGVDAAAEIMCRMHGWEVRTFPDIEVRAQRRVLTGGSTILHTRYRRGFANYLLGYHPLFQLASCLSRIGEKPYLVGSMAMLLGYGVPWLGRYSWALPDDVCRFLRLEQMRRLSCCVPARRAVRH
jgi:biofilm PGA synthesis N-glycosyltransferase PgaC